MGLSELGERFDEDYFRRGIQTRKSLYEDFRWLPWVSLPQANSLKLLYKDAAFLDYGCAMGYLVYALRLLRVEAYGYDISPYALANVKPEVKDVVFGDKNHIPKVDVLFGKDVLEHIGYDEITLELHSLTSIASKAFFILPLGENGRYRISEYGYDDTHAIIEDEEWWIKTFNSAGYEVEEFYHSLHGFKERWVDRCPHGNGMFRLKVRGT
jgi:hypothetical protein